jgi:hypothetical protein
MPIPGRVIIPNPNETPSSCSYLDPPVLSPSTRISLFNYKDSARRNPASAQEGDRAPDFDSSRVVFRTARVPATSTIFLHADHNFGQLFYCNTIPNAFTQHGSPRPRGSPVLPSGGSVDRDGRRVASRPLLGHSRGRQLVHYRLHDCGQVQYAGQVPRRHRRWLERLGCPTEHGFIDRAV